MADESGAGDAAALEALVRSWHSDTAGHLKAREVNRLLELFARLEHPTPPPASGKPRLVTSSVDGFADSDEVKICITALVSPPARPLSQVVQVLQELSTLERLFSSLVGSRLGMLELMDSNDTCSIFNKWCMKFQPGNQSAKMVMQYYDRQHYGAELRVSSFSKWVWEELRILEENFQEPRGPMLDRFCLLARVSRPFQLGIWTFSPVRAEELQDVLAALRGTTLEAMTSDARSAAITDVEAFCNDAAAAKPGLEVPSLDPQKLREYMRDQASALAGVWQLDAVATAFEAFAARRQTLGKVSASFRSLDQQGAGFIKITQLRSVMSKICAFPQEELDVLMQGVVLKEDGRVDYTEFAKWVLMPIAL